MNLFNIPAHKNCTNCGECCGVINGFGLTAKGFESETYKKANKFLDEEYRRMAEMTEEEIQREMEQEG